MSAWKIDLHCHTSYSYDGWTRPAELIRRARAADLTRICITDHGNMRGAFEAASLEPELVIPGQEIRCASGTELIGIGLSVPIPDGLTERETAAAIREQGALVYAPHPFAYPRQSNVHASRALAVADVIEVFNPRAFLPRWNARALASVEQGSAVAASSDAHFPWEIGRAWTEVRPFQGMPELLEALRQPRLSPDRRTSWACHVLSVGLAVSRRVVGRARG